ncbi:MAG: MobF family relaxase [Ferruginibacter sp.]
MIRMLQSVSGNAAKRYFNDGLQRSDYYMDKQEIVEFKFHGKLSERIGISNTGSKELFHILIENFNPVTGEKLTARKKANRTVGYDISFHCPKDVSLLHVLSKDNHILDVFKQSVNETMKDIEEDSLVRVRKDNKDENRKSGELLWAEFIHLTSRPTKGKTPDPHLHCHCYTFNMAWDNIEQQFKAGQFRNIKRDMPYYQARFHKRLSDGLIKLGYRIGKTKDAFQILGIPKEARELFSKRTLEIKEFAEKNNIVSAKELDQLGSRTRAKKQKGLTMSQLIKDWRQQIHSLGMNSTEANGTIIRHNTIEDSESNGTEHSINYSLEHHFERSSVFQDRKVLATTYRYALGNSIASIDSLDKAFTENKNIIHVKDEDINYCTTNSALEDERLMISLALQGKKKFKPFYQAAPELSLKGEQADAVRTILTSRDQVSIIEGRAGTGKTTLMKEAVRLIENTGQEVIVVAPTAQAARSVLKEEGFDNAETVAKLLTDKKLQQKLYNGVLWVDEAGLLGNRDMTAILTIAKKQKAKVILGGDVKQHSSVGYGDALRLLKVLGGIGSSQVNTIYRQTNKLYREAVQYISDGNIHAGFKQLEAMGSIIEIDQSNPSNKLIKDYLNAINKGNSALVISPTHKQGESLTEDIREALKDRDIIGRQDHLIKKLTNLNLTLAEKGDLINYFPGLILQFNQNSKGIKRGSIWKIDAIKKGKMTIIGLEDSKEICIEKEKTKFDVFLESSLEVSKNDLIRITRNGFDKQNKRLNNGQELQVIDFEKDNCIKLINPQSKTEYILKEDFGHITHAYCTTSHASQGKTVDEVFIYQPTSTFPATDRKQFYVSVSRGRKSAKIYTDDKLELYEYASKERNRMSAMELLDWKKMKEFICKPSNVISSKRNDSSKSTKPKEYLFPN